MTVPWRPGLSARIVLFIGAIVALCGILTVMIISSIITTQLHERYVSDRQTSIEFLTASLVPMVELQDYERIERTIQAVLVYENIVSLSVYDADGALIRTATESGEGSRPTDTISHILTQGSVLVGRVDIGFSRAYIDAQVNELTRILAIAVSALLVATALALLWYFSRAVVQPLNLFTRTVRSMTSDNLALRVPLKGSDEIGVLADSFNAMAQDLDRSNRQLREAHRRLEERYAERAAREERRTEQLRRIFEMRQQIIRISELPQMLRFVAAALQEAFSYYSVNVFLLDPETEELRLAATAGKRWIEAETHEYTPPTNGIVGVVLSSCRPLLVTDVSRDPRYIAAEGLEDTQAELAVPIAIGNLILGVLDIQDNEEGGLDEMDLFTAQTVADQIASVVENARVAEETRELTMLDERNRMAREIHDTLAQGFTGIVLQLEAAEQSLQDAPASASRHIDRARRLARESLAEARRSVWALRPSELENGRLSDALKGAARQLTEEGRTRVACHVPGSVRLQPNVEDALLRICQEALSNIRRHAAATQADVMLSLHDGLVRLTISDNGVGFDPETPREGSFGLIGISERARQFGGAARIKSSPGQGTTIDVEIPIARRPGDEQYPDSDSG